MRAESSSRRAFLRGAAIAGAGIAAGCATTGGTTRSARGTAEPPSRPTTNISIPSKGRVAPQDVEPEEPTAGNGIDDLAVEPAEPVTTRPSMEPDAIVRCAVIGVGGQGSLLLQALLEREDVEVVAIADAYDVWRDRAVAWCARRRPATGYVEFADMLEREPVHAVFVAAPDHIHAPAVQAALGRGADVYCEPPLAMDAAQAAEIASWARREGAIVEMGQVWRSAPAYAYARDALQKGDIGEIIAVEARRHYIDRPLSEFQPPREATKNNVHWKTFLGDTDSLPFDLVRFFQWPRFQEYSNASMGVLLGPFLDVCHYLTGCGMPQRMMASGGIYRFDDGRTCPDTYSVVAEYPEGFQLNFQCAPVDDRPRSFQRLVGTEGSIEIHDMSRISVYRENIPEELDEAPSDVRLHVGSFLDRVRTRRDSHHTAHAGVMEAVCSAMAMRSMIHREVVGLAGAAHPPSAAEGQG